jgi:hypothetical protein
VNTPAHTIQPDAKQWGSLLRQAPPLDDRARRFRQQLHLPTDQPIIFAGHQAQLWHPGILAKALAQSAAARALSAAPAWVVVDQDDNDPWTIRYPVRSASGTLEARTWQLAAAATTRNEHVPVANRQAQPITPIPSLKDGERFAALSVAAGLSRIAEALKKHAGETSAAAQLARAMTDLLQPVIPNTITIGATGLSRTDLFADTIAHIRRDPARAVQTYNHAVAAHPGARIAPLNLDGDPELPLWHIPARQSAPRRRVLASTLASIPIHELAPRALLTTGILRSGACDLFVHGLGGAGNDGSSGYDAITTDWFRDWLGQPLAPTATVSATLRLNIESSGPRLTPEQIARARWTAHAARHHPQLLGDNAAELERGQAVATLRRLRWKRDPDSKRIKLETYRGLHRTLEAVRARRATDLARFDTEAAAAAARRAEAEIIADRTWAWPLYQPDQIAALKSAIDAAFAG